MHLVVDTSVWSLVLRRPRIEKGDPYVREFVAHIEAEDVVFILGLILQELLDGVRSERAFGRMLRVLATFPLIAPGPRNTCPGSPSGEPLPPQGGAGKPG